MSSSENKTTTAQFIPILTEVITSGADSKKDKSSGQKLQATLFPSFGLPEPKKEPPIINQKGSVQIGKNVSVEEVIASAPPTLPINEAVIEDAVDDDETLTHTVDDVLNSVSDDVEEWDDAPEEFIDAQDNGVFSPLSHNPIEIEDSLRPSDLMLVALTERISNKVRIRVRKDLDTHINNKVFPLLDEFAARLVKQMETDIIKLIRESLAEVTREELERLSNNRIKK